MDLFKAIMSRRSIRQFKPIPVSDSEIYQVLDAARHAPSWHNSQCWRFIVVKNDATREKLAQTVPPINRGSKAILRAPVLIVLCAELGHSGYIKGELIPDKGENWYMFDVALAAQNLVLAAHALGLGTLIIGYFNPVEAGKILDVPEGTTVVALIPLGYPEIPAIPTSRKEFGEIVFYEKYNRK